MSVPLRIKDLAIEGLLVVEYATVCFRSQEGFGPTMALVPD
jgi:hypothetical protein